jgi:ribosome maturation factor RimP
MLTAKHKDLDDIFQPVVEGMGFEYVGCELMGQGRHSLLRVYIDSPESKGVNIDECAKVSRQLSAVLDVEDPIKGQYQLEISSPGLERPLFTLEHYQRFVGSKVKVRLIAPIDGQKNFVGYLKSVDESMLVVHENEKDISIPLQAIFKTNLVFEN